MQLKKLEMCGFKSFANRTEILFDRGVTGIVGPNGCGKSNVVDAIKWVLGTLSYKSVRGEEMMDVIFKGAEGVPAMGFAEVSLTLDNADHTLPLEFDEVTITRKLFSTGEGEYLINRAVCRLKDIRDLLYGTGIGTDNYSLIEQMKITKLVDSNAHERRLIFDEAAGISKYRARRRETEHRLDKVTQDLLRIQDMAGEVQKQLRSVRAQAGRAQRYKEINDEWKARRLRLVVHDHRMLEARGAEIADRLRQLTDERERLRVELEAAGRAHEDVQRRLEAEGRRHGELQSALAGLEQQAAYLERTLEAAVQRRGELEEERRRLDEEHASLEAKAREAADQVERETQVKEDLESIARTRAAEADELRLRLDDAAAECARTTQELEARRTEVVELAHKEAQYRNERDRLRKDSEGLESRAAALRARSEKLDGELVQVRSRMESSRAARAGLEIEISGLMQAKRDEEAVQARLREERAQVERELLQLREGKDHRVARRETLRDLEESYEGLETGAKALLRERPEGVLGAVADFLDVAPEHVAAVEAALGERAGAVVCVTAADAERAAALVRERGWGRTLLLSLEECRNGHFDPSELAVVPGILGRAHERAQVEERFRPMADALLGHTLVVQDPVTAREARRAGLAAALVTPEGERFDFPGLVTTGSKALQGLLSRKAELRRLQDEIGRYLELITQREGRQAETEIQIDEAAHRLEQVRQQVYEKTVAMSDVDKEAAQLEGREQAYAVECEALGEELEAVGRQSKAVEDRGAALDSLLAQLEWLKAQVTQELATLAETLARYERGRAELQEGLQRAQMDRTRANEQMLSARKHLEMLEGMRAEAGRAVERLAERRTETAGRLDVAAGEVRRTEAEREELGRTVAGARERAAEAGRQAEALAAESESAREAKTGIEARVGPCEAEIGGLRVEEGQQQTKLEALVQRAREEEIDLSAAAAAAPPEEGTDWEAVAHEAEELRISIQRFGSVNAVALDQLQELEEREKFMLGQKEDLDQSKGQLEDLIRELNLQSRELFDKTIDLVREQFNVIFRKVFGGGKADIIVEQAEGVDPMEQGLEITARPPGKQDTSISLLSGGERSLTAIALVMALFKANPGPFCLLDEADAALDEKNVERYAGLIREFAADTQFIVITHNKRTMAVTDVLYGVTMEQQGVSKKVSVNLAGDQGLDVLKAKGAPAVPQAAPAAS